MIFGFYVPPYGEAAWAALPEDGEQPPRYATGVIPGGGGIAAVAGFLACHLRVHGAAAPRAVVLAPDDGSGVDELRQWLPATPRTRWCAATEAMAAAAVDEMSTADDSWAICLRVGAAPNVVRAAAMAWKELRRLAV